MKRMKAIVGIIVGSLALAGCATSKVAQQEQEQLRNQVAGLQTQVAALNSQVEELRTRQQSIEDRTWDQGTRTATAVAEGRTSRKTHTVLTAKEIQLALQRAGYYQGPIDGRIGAKTRSAIKIFQAANNLVADGVAGSKTMVALQAYLTSAENGQ